MWILTQHGIASIVQDWDDPDKVWVRARNKKDIEAIRDMNVALVDAKVEHHPERDYEWRFQCSRHDFLIILVAVGQELDYDNFKNRATKTTPHNTRALYSAYNGIMKATDTHNKPKPVYTSQSALPLDPYGDTYDYEALFGGYEYGEYYSDTPDDRAMADLIEEELWEDHRPKSRLKDRLDRFTDWLNG